MSKINSLLCGLLLACLVQQVNAQFEGFAGNAQGMGMIQDLMASAGKLIGGLQRQPELFGMDKNDNFGADMFGSFGGSGGQVASNKDSLLDAFDEMSEDDKRGFLEAVLSGGRTTKRRHGGRKFGGDSHGGGNENFGEETEQNARYSNGRRGGQA